MYKKIVLTVFISVFSIAITNAQGVVTSDYQALLALYQSMDGDHWINKRNWLSDKPVADWNGITVANQRVVGIDLGFNNLNGNLPAEIRKLTELKILDVAKSSLSAQSIEYILYLTNLEHLDICQNNIEMEIPADISKLTKLKYFDASRNKLSGTFLDKVSTMKDLEFLSILNNTISGTIPAELGNCTKIKELNLANNKLSGNIPETLGNLINLESFTAFNNQFSGTLPDIFGKMTKLWSLSLRDNNFSGTIPASIGNLTKMERLDLANNNFSGTVPSLSKLKSLTELQINGNSFTFADLDNIGLNLSQNWFSYTPQKSVAQPKFSEEGGKKYLEVTYEYNIYDVLVWYIDGVKRTDLFQKKLDITNLSGSVFTCEVSNEKYPNLVLKTKAYGKDVVLSHGLIEAEYNTLVDFAQSTNYRDWLNNQNWLSDLDAEYWKGIRVANGRIVNIQLASNNLSGPLPPSLGNLSVLEFLLLSQNRISGALPGELGNLKKLSGIDLYGNLLTGSIPVEIGNMESLKTLNLSNNLLTGSIPQELTKLQKATTIQLNGNYLSGSVPNLKLIKNFLICYLHDNNFNFSDLSTSNITGIFSSNYAPQKALPKPVLQESNGEQFLLAGDTLSGNEYKWYKDQVIVNPGNSNKLKVDLLGNGKYYCSISNKKFSLLTLTTDTLVFVKSSKEWLPFSTNGLEDLSLKYNPHSKCIEVLGAHKGNIEFDLFSTNGSRILKSNVITGGNVSVGHLPEGVYMVALTAGNKFRKAQKLLIR